MLLKKLVQCFQVSKKQLIELYRKRWAELGDNKKMKYIRKALDAKLAYDVSPSIHCFDVHYKLVVMYNL